MGWAGKEVISAVDCEACWDGSLPLEGCESVGSRMLWGLDDSDMVGSDSTLRVGASAGGAVSI